MFLKVGHLTAQCIILLIIFETTLSIYSPNEIEQTSKPYTSGLKIRVSHYKSFAQPYYHSNYSKVYVHNKNYTSSLLSNTNHSDLQSESTQYHPVYISDEKKEKIQNVLNEHNTNVVEKDTLNDRIVYKIKVKKPKSVQVYNSCPKGATGQFVYDLACNQYLDCWNGRGGPRNCAPGTLFNPKTLECDFPEKVECLTGLTGNSLTLQRSAKLQTQNQAKCPENFSGLIPNYTDCSKFIQCNNGISMPSDCPPGTLFDTNINVCNHAKETTCFSGQNKHHRFKEEFGGSMDVFATEFDHNRRQGTGLNWQQMRQQLGHNHAGRFDQNQLGSGSTYYFPGASSNQQTSGCDPTNPYCTSGGYVISGHSILNMYPPQPGGGYNKPESDNSRSGTVYIQYVMCNPSVEDCSTFQQGTYMMGPGGALCDPATQQCGQKTFYIPNNKMSRGNPEQDSQSSVGTYFIKYVVCNTVQEDCSKFPKGVIEAAYGAQSQRKCNPQIENCDPVRYSGGHGRSGQPCNPRYQQCNRPSDAQVPCNPRLQNCCNPQTQNCPPNSATGFGYQYHGQGQSGGHQTQSSNGRINYKKVCAAGDENCYRNGANAEPKCPERFQGVTKHPGNCKKFLNCANGITYIQDCAPGTLFNPNLNVCDFPYNVDCKDEDGEITTLAYEQDNNYHTPCQGQFCNEARDNRNSFNRQDLSQNPYGQTGFSQNSYGQTGCRGSQCNQNAGQYSTNNYNNNGGFNVPNQDRCQGLGCINNQGLESQTNCQGVQCASNQGYQGGGQGQFQNEFKVTTPRVYKWPYEGCQGNRCFPNTENEHGNEQGQIQNNQDQISPYFTTSSTPTEWPISHHGSTGYQDVPANTNQNGHIMKIRPNTDHLRVEPINKSDRKTSAGFNNQRATDYVDIFDPDESKNIAYASTTVKSLAKPQKQTWPPPFPEQPSTDTDADYVFEYEDGEPVTLTAENGQVDKRKKSRCDNSDFMCTKRSCVAKNFVCDGVRDCDDGKDEKYCQKYLDEFKPYKNSRLDVLEKQRWDNVSYSTCALLCMDNGKFECKSFNYRKVDKACFLTNENIGTSGALKDYYPCDYYERKALSLDCVNMHKCPNGKCLSSDQICDGYDDCGNRADEKGCRPQDFGYSVKLAGGLEPQEGRIEVTVFGKTGYICDDQFKMTDANVLCKELGFELGALEVKGNSFYAKDLKENRTLYMMDDIQCLGNETSIMQCDFAGWGIHNCADREIAGVICKTPQETCSEGYFKCDTGNECVRIPFVCDGLDDCSDNSDEASHHCDSPITLRLVNGTNQNEGRLEIRYHGIWGSICDDDFNEDAAKIACNSLGYSGSAFVRKDGLFGSSNGPIWLDQVSCKGNETSLDKCTHWDWGEHNCDHTEDVGIFCSNTFSVEPKRNSKHFNGRVTEDFEDIESTNSSPEPVSCGYRKDNIFLQSDDVHFRVVRGSVANPGDYPWQAALRIKGQEKTAHWCGAVVIASRWVLTAAHCLEGYPKGAYIIVAGEYNVDENEGTEQQAFIEEYYLHENFRKGHKMGNDIALILLKGKGFRLNQDIQPICLPEETSDYERELNCTISGFGTIETGRSAYSHRLRAAWIPVQKMDVCKMAHIYGENIGEGMICAGDLTGGVDACDGDSGGPLACLEDGVFTLYGLTSWGQRCGYANKPGVYVKVSYYKKWIEQTMKSHS